MKGKDVCQLSYIFPFNVDQNSFSEGKPVMKLSFQEHSKCSREALEPWKIPQSHGSVELSYRYRIWFLIPENTQPPTDEHNFGTLLGNCYLIRLDIII